MKWLQNFARQALLFLTFRNSGNYWERRYRLGGTSGSGSYGSDSAYKARFLNEFVQRNHIESVIELGCGDGNQLSLGTYPRYLGLDVSKSAIRMCQERFKDDPTKAFLWYDPQHATNLGVVVDADLTISLDVIFHLVEDEVYEKYLDDLFAISRRYVLIYGTDRAEPTHMPHLRHRAVTHDVLSRFPAFQPVNNLPKQVPDRHGRRFLAFERKPTAGASKS